MLPIYQKLHRIAEIEFSDIVEDVDWVGGSLRIYFFDKSYLDIWLSWKKKGIYSYHWERRHIDGKIFRHDNIPHKKWQNVITFPRHFHAGSEEEKDIRESNIDVGTEDGLRIFLLFIRSKIIKT